MKTAKTSLIYALLLPLTIVLQSFSFLSIKYSTLQTGVTTIVLLILALGLLGLRAILWQRLLKLTDLSHVYPFAALVQVLILLYAVLLFDESISLNNVIGLLLMLIGVYFLSRQVT